MLRLISFLQAVAAMAMAADIYVYADRSGSVDVTRSRLVFESFTSAVRASASVSGIHAVPFGDAESTAAPSRPTVFSWGDHPRLEAFDPGSVKLSLEQKVFAQAGKRAIEAAKSAHNTAGQRLTTEWEARREDTLAAFTAFALERSAPSAPCTRFDDLARRIRRERWTNAVVFTDGVFDCRDVIIGDAGRTALPGRLVIVLLPAKGDNDAGSRAARVAARERMLLSLFPTAAVLEPYELDSRPELLWAGAREPETIAVAGPSVVRVHTASPVPARQTSPDSRPVPVEPRVSAVDTEAIIRDLVALVRKHHRSNVRQSWGVSDGENFTDRDYEQFVAGNIAERAAQAAQQENEFREIASALHRLPPAERAPILRAGRSTRDKTWTELRCTCIEGQTEAGVRAQLLISGAIADALEQSVRSR